VTENAKCASKIRREGGVLAQAFADVEAGADYDTTTLNGSIVHCGAKCAFNGDGICSTEAYRAWMKCLKPIRRCLLRRQVRV
jgi:hypothetical protein